MRPIGPSACNFFKDSYPSRAGRTSEKRLPRQTYQLIMYVGVEHKLFPDFSRTEFSLVLTIMSTPVGKWKWQTSRVEVDSY